MPPAHVKAHPPPGHAGEQSLLHSHPASAVCVDAHAVSIEASAVAASLPPSWATQSVCTDDCERMAAHWVSSDEASACWHCSWSEALLQYGHISPSCVHGSTSG